MDDREHEFVELLVIVEEILTTGVHDASALLQIFQGSPAQTLITEALFSSPGISDRDTAGRMIEACIKNAEDIITLLLVADAVRRAGARVLRLCIPYFPYARQDRVCNDGEALSVSVIASLINSADFAHVRIFDPHSDVAPALIKNCDIVSQVALMDNLPKDAIGDALVSPDAGSEKKVRAAAKRFNVPMIVCGKDRDVATGNIISSRVVSGDPAGLRVMIVDDICDGGATFISLAKILKELGAAEINLFVTHGIFSKGFKVFEGLIENIYCTNSLWQDQRCRPEMINVWRNDNERKTA